MSIGLSAESLGKKIVVVSDPHVMAPGLLVSAGDAWNNYLNDQRKLVDYSKPLFDEMIRRIKEDIQPELVLVTGDLTKDGEQLSHQYVISKLDELQTAGIQTLVIPGNHDRGSNSNAVYYNGDGTTPADVADNDWFATQYANYGYGASSERLDGTLTYACEPITGLVVIGIDSGTDGVVSSTTLNWVVEKATEARANGKKVIAMMHHPLIPHFTGVDNFVETAVVANYETVRNALADAGVKVVFTGHFHTSDIAMDKNADLSRDIYDVNTGSLISYPCDYRVVTLSNDLSELSITTGHISDVLPKQINVTDGTHSVTFELNETSAAQSLYGMLPITKEVQNYSTNEKIFYPETAISYGSDCIEDDCPAGTLALFSPWGNVVMYYGDANKYTGLYVLGHAIEGEDQISELTGNITVTQVGLAKERLKTAVKNTISAKGAAYSMIAPTAAETFIIHAEGNEPENVNAATLLSQLVSAANAGAFLIGADKAQALKDMANSMLQDKSQYGVEGRENVTNDLTLNIGLTVITSLKANEGETGEFWATYYDGANSCIVDANTTVYTGKVSGDKIALTEIVDKTIPAGNAVILKSTATDVELTETTATGTLANNDLKGVDVTTAKTDVYCLSKSGTTVGFYKYTGDVPAHRAYIESISGARMFSLDGGDATGIVSMEDERGIRDDRADMWYSLDGCQLNGQPTRKGIYVKDGKKVVIK
jgi:predicted MPP superfamily phosphohydrolase